MKNSVNDKFVEYFAEFQDCYVVIGGTALSIVTTQIGLPTRVTKDYDLVLIEENLTKEFMDKFHKFIEDGGYNQYEKLNSAIHSLYRFDKPTDKDFPEMIEIYSRNPINFKLSVRNQRRPIAFDGADSLSALLLNDEYYELIEHATLLSDEGLRYLSIGYLIVFKAKAWLDLTLRKNEGEIIKSSDIRKHVNDVFRMAQGLTGNELLYLNETVVDDMKKFIQGVNESEIDYANNISSELSKEETINVLAVIFGFQQQY